MLDIIFSSRPSFGFATFCPTQNVTPPDEIATRNDLLNELQSAIQSWPPEEREIFELYFVEGFETDE
ncbi:MAG TPA: hypothetical protein VIT00_09605 [Terrimicrobiaceae bacterium]